MACETYKEARGKLVESVAYIWFEKKCHGNLNLSREMLIGPRFSDKLSSKEDNRVKFALFEFLQDTKAIWAPFISRQCKYPQEMSFILPV